MQPRTDGGLCGKQANENLVGGGKEGKKDGMCQEDSLNYIHATRTHTNTEQTTLTLFPQIPSSFSFCDYKLLF